MSQSPRFAQKIGNGYSNLVQASLEDVRSRPAGVRWALATASVGLVAIFALTIFAPFQEEGWTALFDRDVSLASTPTSAIEAESGATHGSVTVGSDTQAAGGSYVRLNVLGDTTGAVFQPSAPYYATFYYPWFRNQITDGSWSGSSWEQSGHNPPSNWFSNYLPDPDPSAFNPSSELYSSNNDATLYWQFGLMAKAKQEIAISSWWGQGHKTDSALRHILDLMKRSDNPYPNLRWCVYYEKEGSANPTVSEIVNDLKYINSTLASQPSYFRINNRPVIFVYAESSDAQDMVTRWSQAKAQSGINFYVVLKVFTGYASASNQPDSWHQYAPAARTGRQGDFYTFVSPGFWRSGDAVRLGRDANDFSAKVQQMVADPVQWKLTQTWNEWGEGTSVEPGTEVNQVSSGAATIKSGALPFGMTYIDILSRYLPGLEQGTGR
jgi:hypothetical protein